MSSDSPARTQPADALAATLKRTEVQHHASSIPGRDIVQVLTEIPVGVSSGWHQHPGEEVGYIIAGTVQMEIRDQPTLTLYAGDGFLITPRTPHNALDLGPGTGMMLSTYLVDAGEPISSVVDIDTRRLVGGHVNTSRPGPPVNPTPSGVARNSQEDSNFGHAPPRAVVPVARSDRPVSLELRAS